MLVMQQARASRAVGHPGVLQHAPRAALPRLVARLRSVAADPRRPFENVRHRLVRRGLPVARALREASEEGTASRVLTKSPTLVPHS